MFKKSLAVAVLACAVAAPASAAVTPLATSLGGLASFSRDAVRTYVLPTGAALLPVVKRLKISQPIAAGTSPNQPFSTLPGLSTLTSLGSTGASKLTTLTVLPAEGKAVISKLTLTASGAKAAAPLSRLTAVSSRLSLKR